MSPLEKCAEIRRQTREIKTTFPDCWRALVKCGGIVELSVLYLENLHIWDNTARDNREDQNAREKWAYDSAREVFLIRQQRRKAQNEGSVF